MTTVSNSFKGYQYYEFALLKDLIPESRKLAEQTSQSFDADEEWVGGGQIFMPFVLFLLIDLHYSSFSSSPCLISDWPVPQYPLSRLDDGASITEGSLIEAAKEVTKGGQEGDASNGTGR